VIRIKEIITKDKMSWYLDKFSLLLIRNVRRTVRRIYIVISGLKLTCTRVQTYIGRDWLHPQWAPLTSCHRRTYFYKRRCTFQRRQQKPGTAWVTQPRYRYILSWMA